MPPTGPTPLFVDTGAFYAWFDGSASRHDRAATVFDGISSGDFPYRPIYTSTYVVDELATLIVSRRDHDTAVEAIDRVRSSVVRVVSPDASDFDRACERFRQYDSRELSFTDHVTAVLAEAYDVEHVFTFDADDFRTLGLVVVPDDTGEA